jgi:hypothetical protein
MRAHFGTLVVASGLFVTGCHADVTFRFDVRSNETALATTREIMDDQLYQLALSQNTDGDPFGMERLQREGWTVSRASDDNGNHIITISKILSRNDLENVGSATALRGGSLPVSSFELSRSPGLFVERDSLSATIPALLPFASSEISRPYASFASAMLGSVVALHLELRTPGKVMATNGETTPNGFVRWDLSMQSPTKVLYTVRVIHFGRILMAILIALAVLFLAIGALRSQLKARAA